MNRVVGYILLLACVAGCGARVGEIDSQSTPDDTDPTTGLDDAVEETLAAGGHHTCALMETAVRCWGSGDLGQLGYGNMNSIGDDETPASAGDVDVGGVVVELALGAYHTCARLDGGAVRCWGLGGFGQLGYGNTEAIGTELPPSSAGDVDVGGVVVELAAGTTHTCARLDTGAVRCWGWGHKGELGYGNTDSIGDDETPASAGDVDLGGVAVEITAGSDRTCARLETGAVRCWGFGNLGYENGETNSIGDDETPASAGDVDVGSTVVDLDAGQEHICALLEAGNVHCWGNNDFGQLGYGHTNSIGDDETPASAGDVDVGGVVVEIAAGRNHTCVRLENNNIRCWGHGEFGQLGYGNTNSIGDDETPASAGDVDIGGAAAEITAGINHTCTRLQNGAVRCWGWNLHGELGYGKTGPVGDDETPASAGDVSIF
jgi:alpha-tubulin suppressor-like RCC1 family protein